MEAQQVETLLNILFLASFVVVILMLAFGAMTSEESPKKKDCKPHIWVTHSVTEKLTCTECGYVAGTYKTERNDY